MTPERIEEIENYPFLTADAVLELCAAWSKKDKKLNWALAKIVAFEPERNSLQADRDSLQAQLLRTEACWNDDKALLAETQAKIKIAVDAMTEALTEEDWELRVIIKHTLERLSSQPQVSEGKEGI